MQAPKPNSPLIKSALHLVVNKAVKKFFPLGDSDRESTITFAAMNHNKLNISRQKMLLVDYRAKLLAKRTKLLKEVGQMAHDDFVVLLEIFDQKLENINKQFNEAEAC